MGKLYSGNTWMAFYIDKFTKCAPDSVTHWMPLPNPPTI